MTDILWRAFQVEHIEERHGVSAEEFEEAWDDPSREDLAQEPDLEWGTSYRSLGSTSDGRVVVMIWRWQDLDGGSAVFPITAFFKDVARTQRRQRKPRRRRRS